jgi:hypothetical protein
VYSSQSASELIDDRQWHFVEAPQWFVPNPNEFADTVKDYFEQLIARERERTRVSVKTMYAWDLTDDCLTEERST